MAAGVGAGGKVTLFASSRNPARQDVNGPGCRAASMFGPKVSVVVDSGGQLRMDAVAAEARGDGPVIKGPVILCDAGLVKRRRDISRRAEDALELRPLRHVERQILVYNPVASWRATLQGRNLLPHPRCRRNSGPCGRKFRSVPIGGQRRFGRTASPRSTTRRTGPR